MSVSDSIEIDAPHNAALAMSVRFGRFEAHGIEPSGNHRYTVGSDGRLMVRRWEAPWIDHVWLPEFVRFSGVVEMCTTVYGGRDVTLWYEYRAHFADGVLTGIEVVREGNIDEE